MKKEEINKYINRKEKAWNELYKSGKLDISHWYTLAHEFEDILDEILNDLSEKVK
jgi:predicted transcriptional regulator